MPATTTSLALLTALASFAPGQGELVTVEPELQPGEVEIGGTRWQQLQRDEDAVPGPMVVHRDVRLERVPGGVEVTARWSIRSEESAWLAYRLLGTTSGRVEHVRWNGRKAPVLAGEAGVLVVERITGDGTLELRAFVPGNPDRGMELELLAAPTGTVTAIGFDDQLTVEAGDLPVLPRRGATRSTGAGTLRLAVVTEEPVSQRGPIVVAQVAVGVTVGDAELRGRGHLRWEVRHGSLERVSFVAHGLGADLTVEGPGVSQWRRDGELVTVTLAEATERSVDLDRRWTTGAPGGAEASLPLPTIVPQDVFRSASAMQLARDGEVDVRPRLDSWTPVASAQLPEWAKGLVEGTPTAAFSRPRATVERGDTLQLLRLEPVPGPPMVVNVADLRVAATADGGTIMRARYEIRNERASHLAVTPPPGMRLVGTTVGGREVRPARDGEVLRIPLKRSLETVQGSMTVPVTVAFVGDGDTRWVRRERREVSLPVVDAPVTVQRVTMHLPPRYRSKLPVGKSGVVDEFDRGNDVGYGFIDDGRVAQADRTLSDAIDAWNDNEFDESLRLLDQFRQIGAYGANLDGLEANISLVRPMLGSSASSDDDCAVGGAPVFASFKGPDSAAARRVRAQARARSGKKKAAYADSKKKAKAYKNAGDYEKAAEAYREALDTSRELDALQDEESVEYEFEAEQLQEELLQLESQVDQGNDAVEDAPDEPAAAAYDFEDDDEFLSEEPIAVESIATKDAAGITLGGAVGREEYAQSMDLLDADEMSLAGARIRRRGFRFIPRLIDAIRDRRNERARGYVPDLPGTWWGGAIIRVPRVGEPVRFQQLLLEAGESRSVPVDARRRRPYRPWSKH